MEEGVSLAEEELAIVLVGRGVLDVGAEATGEDSVDIAVEVEGL